MPRYPRNVNFGGRPAPASAASATAVAVPARSAPRGRPPGIPGPPQGIVIGAAVAVAVGYAMRYYLEQPVEDQIDRGRYWDVPGKRKADKSPDGTFNYPGGMSGPLEARTSVFKDVDFEQEYYGEFVPSDGDPTKGVWLPTVVLPPHGGNEIKKRTPITAVMPRTSADLERTGVRPTPLRILPSEVSRPEEVIDTPGRVVSRPVPIPGVNTRPGTVTSVGVTPGQISHVATMSPNRELKSAADSYVAGVVTRFLGTGGEIIDFTRCFIFALGFTYTNRQGKEKAIPRSQWNEYLNREWKIRNTPEKVSKGVVKKHRRYTDRYSAQEKGQRLVKCLIMNHIEDAVIGMSSRAKRDFAREFNLNAGFLGIDSQLRLVNGELAYGSIL